MKIEAYRDKLMTNYEVLDHICQVKQRHRAMPQYLQSENLETILLEVQSYLRDRPTGQPGQEQKRGNIEQVVRALVPMQLEKAEILQIINTAPASAPVLFSIVDECDQRFSEEQIDQILELCGEKLGKEPVPEAQE